MNPTDCLRRKCTPLADGRQPDWHHSPFHVTSNGQPWTVATNGFFLVALAGHLPDYQPGLYQAQSQVGILLQPVADWWESIPLPLLRDWCGTPELLRVCTCQVGCEQCDHSQIVYPDARPGKFLDRVLDLQMLGAALEGLDGRETRLKMPLPGNEGVMTLEPDITAAGDQPAWRVVFVPMSPSPDKAATTPRMNTLPIDPTWLTWEGGNVPRLARFIQQKRRFQDLPILADALEEAGCTNADVLNHCRGGGPHIHDCWVIDWLLNG